MEHVQRRKNKELAQGFKACLALIYLIVIVFLIGAVIIPPLFIFADAPKKNLPAEPGGPATQFKEAEENFRLGNLSLAINLYLNFLRDYPQHPLAPKACLQIGKCFQAKKEFEDALKFYQKVLQDYPQDKETGGLAKLGIGIVQSTKKEYDKAIETFQQLVKEYGDNKAMLAYGYFNLGEAYKAKKHFKEAINWFQKVIKLGYSDPTGMPLKKAKTELLECQKRLQEYEREKSGKLGNVRVARTPEEAVDALFSLAWLALEHGDEETAVWAFDTVVKRYPKHPQAPEALMQLGWHFGRLNQKDEVIRIFEQVVSYFPKSKEAPEALMHLGYIYGEKKEHQKAIQAFERVVKDYPESKLTAEALTHIGWLHLELKKPEKTMEVAQKLLEKYPARKDLPDILMGIAWCYLGKGEKDKALEAFQEVADRYPKSDQAPDALMQIGYISGDKKEHERAIKAFERVARDYPEYKHRPAALMHLGYLYGDKKEHEKALAAFNEVIQKHSDRKDEAIRAQRQMMYLKGDTSQESFRKIVQLGAGCKPGELPADVEFTVAEAQATTGDLEGAILRLEAIKNKFPEKTEEVERRTIDCLRGAKRYDETIEKGRVFLQKYPNSRFAGDVQYVIGYCYEQKGDYEKALEEHEKLINYKGFEPLRLLVLGWCNYMLKKYDKAAAAYQKLVINHPDCDSGMITEAINLLVNCYRFAGHEEKAIEEFKRLLAEYSSNTLITQLAQYYIAKLQFQKGEYDQAVIEIDKFLSLHPSNENQVAEALYWKAGCYYVKENYKEAIRELDKILKNYSKSPVAGEAQRFLELNRDLLHISG